MIEANNVRLLAAFVCTLLTRFDTMIGSCKITQPVADESLLNKKEIPMGLIYDLPKQVSWHPEEGTWPGVCQAVLDMQDTVKINFTIHIPGSQTTEYRAGNKYEGVLEEGTLLYRDLWTWLKGDFSILRNEQGKLDLRRLVGIPADLVLTHIHNSSHATPYVHIATIRAAGTLVRSADVLKKTA
jgi:hypothetical protein